MPTIGEIQGQVLQQRGSLVQNIASNSTPDLAQTTKESNFAARRTPNPIAEVIQQTSREPREFKPAFVDQIREVSRNAQSVDPDSPKAPDPENRIYPAPELQGADETVGGINIIA